MLNHPFSQWDNVLKPEWIDFSQYQVFQRQTWWATGDAKVEVICTLRKHMLKSSNLSAPSLSYVIKLAPRTRPGWSASWWSSRTTSLLNCETAGKNARNGRSRAAISDLHELASLCRHRALRTVPFMDYAMAGIPNVTQPPKRNGWKIGFRIQQTGFCLGES